MIFFCFRPGVGVIVAAFGVTQANQPQTSRRLYFSINFCIALFVVFPLFFAWHPLFPLSTCGGVPLGGRPTAPKIVRETLTSAYAHMFVSVIVCACMCVCVPPLEF